MLGRRRVGKSRLIKEFGKKYRFLQFSGLPPMPDTTNQDQLNEFAGQLGAALGIAGIKADDWSALFSLLAQSSTHGKTVILLDEISWMGSKDPNFLGKLKNAWDMYFKNNPQLVLVLCGSVSHWIEKNILTSTGFVGRISLVIALKELSLLESSLFLDKLGYIGSVYDKFKILSVTGGIPKYIEEIKSNMSAEENIKRLAFRSNGLLFREFNDIFADLFASRSTLYKQIVEYLAKGSAELNDIINDLKLSKNGNVSEYLDILVKAGFLQRDYTWSIKTGIPARLSHFRLSDNYSRFYLKYVDKNRLHIEQGHFDDKSMTTLPRWESVMGLQFENLVLNNRRIVLDALRVYGEDIVSDNPFFQRKTVRTQGCQIDYMIQTKYNSLYVCEVKFSKTSIGISIVDEMKEKLGRLSVPHGFSVVPVLIHVNGVDDAVLDAEYFKGVVDFGAVLEQK